MASGMLGGGNHVSFSLTSIHVRLSKKSARQLASSLLLKKRKRTSFSQSDFNYPLPGITVSSDGNSSNASSTSWKSDSTSAVIGSGRSDFEKATAALQKWKMFQLGWAEVDPETPVKIHEPVVVVARAVVPWTCNPLEIVYVHKTKREFAFAHGTCHGHLLRGEERFAVRLDDNGDVVYTVSAVSQPAHIASKLTYPVVRLLQKRFAEDSVKAMERALM